MLLKEAGWFDPHGHLRELVRASSSVARGLGRAGGVAYRRVAAPIAKRVVGTGARVADFAGRRFVEDPAGTLILGGALYATGSHIGKNIENQHQSQQRTVYRYF